MSGYAWQPYYFYRSVSVGVVGYGVYMTQFVVDAWTPWTHNGANLVCMVGQD